MIRAFKAAIVDDAAYAGDLPPLPENWPTETPPAPPALQRSLLSDPNILPEYRVVGCPMFACTQGNVSYTKGWYYAFAAPRSGTITGFMWQTQGARKHAEPADLHSGGNFGNYTLKFYRGIDFGSNKAGLLATANLTQSSFFPGWQDNGYNPNTNTPYGGAEYATTLHGGLQVHSWLNRVVLNSQAGQFYYSGTAFVVAPIGNNWQVQAGDVILAEFVNADDSSSANFSLDNDGILPTAPLPGSSGSNSPMDYHLGIRGINSAGTQPIVGRTESMMPFFMLRYSDDKWFGQPWYYRGQYPGGDTGAGLFDVHATQPNTALPSGTPIGPALLLYGTGRLRQVLTPPADFSGGTFNQIFVHAWRWTSLVGYTDIKRLGVRILSVNSTSGPDLTTGLTQVWPPNSATGSDVFYVAGLGPFKGFNATSIKAFGENVVSSAQPLRITPSNLTKDTKPSRTDFMKAVTKIPYGVLTISPAVTLSASKRYIIEFAAEGNSAYALQMLKNPARYINKVRKKKTGTPPTIITDTSQGRAFTSSSSQNAAIDMPQVWGCHPQEGPDDATEASLNVGRYFNCAGKAQNSTTAFTYFYAQALPVCLKSTT